MTYCEICAGPMTLQCPNFIDVGKLARCAARKNAAKPQTTRRIADKRKKPVKHKKPLRED